MERSTDETPKPELGKDWGNQNLETLCEDLSRCHNEFQLNKVLEKINNFLNQSGGAPAYHIILGIEATKQYIWEELIEIMNDIHEIEMLQTALDYMSNYCIDLNTFIGTSEGLIEEPNHKMFPMTRELMTRKLCSILALELVKELKLTILPRLEVFPDNVLIHKIKKIAYDNGCLQAITFKNGNLNPEIFRIVKDYIYGHILAYYIDQMLLEDLEDSGFADRLISTISQVADIIEAFTDNESNSLSIYKVATYFLEDFITAQRINIDSDTLEVLKSKLTHFLRIDSSLKSGITTIVDKINYQRKAFLRKVIEQFKNDLSKIDTILLIEFVYNPNSAELDIMNVMTEKEFSDVRRFIVYLTQSELERRGIEI